MNFNDLPMAPLADGETLKEVSTKENVLNADDIIESAENNYTETDEDSFPDYENNIGTEELNKNTSADDYKTPENTIILKPEFTEKNQNSEKKRIIVKVKEESTTQKVAVPLFEQNKPDFLPKIEDENAESIEVFEKNPESTEEDKIKTANDKFIFAVVVWLVIVIAAFLIVKTIKNSDSGNKNRDYGNINSIQNNNVEEKETNKIQENNNIAQVVNNNSESSKIIIYSEENVFENGVIPIQSGIIPPTDNAQDFLPPVPVKVNTEKGSLNLRTSPYDLGKDNIISQIPKETWIDCFAIELNDAGNEWCYLKYNNQLGWALRKYLEF